MDVRPDVSSGLSALGYPPTYSIRGGSEAAAFSSKRQVACLLGMGEPPWIRMPSQPILVSVVSIWTECSFVTFLLLLNLQELSGLFF